MPVCRMVFLNIWFSVRLFLSLYWSVFLSALLPVCQHICLFCLSVCPSLFLTDWLPACQSVCCICLSSPCLSVCLPITIRDCLIACVTPCQYASLSALFVYHVHVCLSVFSICLIKEFILTWNAPKARALPAMMPILLVRNDVTLAEQPCKREERGVDTEEMRKVKWKVHTEGSVTQRRNSIFCQNEYLTSKCSEKCGLSRIHKDLTPPSIPWSQWIVKHRL